MGLFSKIGKSLFGNTLNAGISESINDFASSKDEFNSRTAPCFDQGYALQYVEALLREIGEGNFYINKNNIYQEFQIRFEGDVFDTFVFEHYARALQVVYRVSTQVKDYYSISDFCNLLNSQDMAHQVGFFLKDSGEYELIVHNSILFTPAIGSLDYLKNSLRQLVEFSKKISCLELPSADDWKQSLPFDLGLNIKTADNVLFPQASDNIWTQFANRTVISENTKEIHLLPIRLVPDGKLIGYCDNRFIVDSKHVQDERIIVYKDSPYIYTLQAEIAVPIMSADVLRDGCNTWNCNTCFTLLTTTWKKISDNDYRVVLRMNVLSAENGNVSTDTDIFVTYIKYIEKLYSDLSSI